MKISVSFHPRDKKDFVDRKKEYSPAFCCCSLFDEKKFFGKILSENINSKKINQILN